MMFDLAGVKFKDILHIEQLQIPKDKMVCIVGESGSGKSTLLRMLNHLITPDEGEIFYNGTNIKELHAVELRRAVVMIPQAPMIFDGNLRDNLLVGLKFSKKPLVPDEDLEAYLRLFKLNKRLEEDVQKLSGGEKQRVALIRGILLNPEVLLLDEPSSALDEDTEHQVITTVVEHMKNNKKSVVMVTHSREIAQHFGEVLIRMENGKAKVERGHLDG